MTMSTVPSARPATVVAWSARPTNRDSSRTSSGNAAKRWRERRVVLGGEHGRRHEDGDLLAVLGRLERRAQGDLGLAVADVADDEPVHRPGQLHVGLDLGRRRAAGRRSPRTGTRPPSRPARASRARTRGPRASARAAYSASSSSARSSTALRTRCLARSHSVAAELRQRRALAAGVARDPADLLDRDEDPVAAGERQLEVVAVLAGAAAPQHPLVAGDAVVDVDDEVARRQPLEDVARDDPPQGPRPADPDGPEQLAVGDEGEAVRAAGEAAVEAPLDERDGAGRRRLPHPADDGDRVAGLAEQVGETRRLVRGEDDPGAVARASARPPRRAGRARPGGQDRLAPAERVARRQRRRGPSRRPRAASDSQVSSSVRDATRRPFQSRGGR